MVLARCFLSHFTEIGLFGIALERSCRYRLGMKPESCDLAQRGSCSFEDDQWYHVELLRKQASAYGNIFPLEASRSSPWSVRAPQRRGCCGIDVDN